MAQSKQAEWFACADVAFTDNFVNFDNASGGAVQLQFAEDEVTPAIAVVTRCHFEDNSSLDGCGGAMDALFDAKFDGDLVSVDNVWINNTQAGHGCVADTQIQLTARLDEQFGSQVRDHAGTPGL